MSGRATGWVLRYGPHPKMLDRDGRRYGARARGLRSVLITIADAANTDGEHSHPGIEAMIDGALYSRRQVIAIVGDLVAEGWVRIEQQGGGRGLATVYAVPGVLEKVQPSHVWPNSNGAVAVEKECSDDLETVQSERETVQSRVHPNGLATDKPTEQRDVAAAPLDALGWSVPAIVLDAGRLDEAIELCELMAGQVEDRGYAGVRAKARSKRWVLDMEALLRLDDRQPDAVRKVLGWLDRGDDEVSSFWRTNVLSPLKLRTRWQQMAEQYLRQIKPKRQRGETFGMERADVDRIVAASRNGGAVASGGQPAALEAGRHEPRRVPA